MKHLIIVKFKENIWNREDAASREMLADIKKIFNRTKQIEGVHTLFKESSWVERCQEWKAKYGKYIQTKTIFDYE